MYVIIFLYSMNNFFLHQYNLRWAYKQPQGCLPSHTPPHTLLSPQKIRCHWEHYFYCDKRAVCKSKATTRLQIKHYHCFQLWQISTVCLPLKHAHILQPTNFHLCILEIVAVPFDRHSVNSWKALLFPRWR